MNITNITFKLLILLGGILLIQGCSQPGVLFNQDKKIHKVAEMRTWHAEGKLAIIEKHNITSTNFRWYQREQQLRINFINNFGFGTAQLDGTYNNFTLRISNGQVIKAENGEQLIAQKLGIHIPLSSLHYWLRGLVDQTLKVDSQHRDKENLLTNLSQGGWHISYASYVQYNSVYLPCKIYLVNDAIRIKIFITNWYQ